MTSVQVMTQTAELTAMMNETVVPLVNRFRSLQDHTGRVVKELETAVLILEQLQGPVRQLFEQNGLLPAADAFEADVQDWLARGLDELPKFDRTMTAYVPPQNGETSFFIAPLLCTNGPFPRGHFLEAFLVLRHEPQEVLDIESDYPHPANGCQSARLLSASDGLFTGHCVVFFPENVATEQKVESQNFAMFFFNKFQKIYENETKGRVDKLFGVHDWPSFDMTPEDCYTARGVWGYLHDYFHHVGPRPFHLNLQAKMNFFCGLLEEIKVDCRTIVTAHRDGYPYAQEVQEFILFERMFRYITQPDAMTNFDTATGLFIFEWLYHNNYGVAGDEKGLTIDMERCVEGLDVLAHEILALEAIEDDKAYKQAAIEYVRKYLPEGEDGRRFSLPDTYSRLVAKNIEAGPVINFYDLPY